MYIIFIILLIYIILDFNFVFTPFISHALITLFCRGKIQTSAEDFDTHSEGESAGAFESAEPAPHLRKDA
jgi:hypothetical protein